MRKIRSASSLFYVVVLFLALFGSCVSHEFPSYTCPDEPVSYSSDVRAIVSTRCAISGCHNGDNGDDKNWTDFSKFQGKSDLVKFRVTNRIMPPASSPAGPLTEDEIAVIACWVDQGAQNN